MSDAPSDIICEVCGEGVEITDCNITGVVIEFYNLTPEYAEYYGFCEEHKPEGEEVEKVKDRIRRGVNPVIT